MTASRIFLSHSTANADVVGRIADELRTLGVDPVVSRERLSAGESFIRSWMPNSRPATTFFCYGRNLRLRALGWGSPRTFSHEPPAVARQDYGSRLVNDAGLRSILRSTGSCAAAIQVEDIAPNGYSLDRATVRQPTSCPRLRARSNAMSEMGQPKKGSRRAYVFRNGPASCRKRTVPALTINPKTRQNDE